MDECDRDHEDDRSFLRQTMTSALVGDQRDQEGRSYAALYHESPFFKSSIDHLVLTFLPALVEGLAVQAEGMEHARLEAYEAAVRGGLVHAPLRTSEEIAEEMRSVIRGRD